MNGIHEVRGSIPLVSTNKHKGFQRIQATRFFIGGTILAPVSGVCAADPIGTYQVRNSLFTGPTAPTILAVWPSSRSRRFSTIHKLPACL